MSRLSRALAALAVSVAVLAGPAWAAEPQPDPWSPVKRFLGEWTGTASGQAGEGTVTRKYAFVMNGRFIQELNLSLIHI